jgi:phage FluMu protein Com
LLEGNVSPLTADELELYVKEWTELVNYTGDEHKVFDFCVCGHDTSKPFFIGNTLNGNVLKMSKGCASELLSPLIGDVVGIYNQIRGYKGTYKMCGTCLNFKIPPVDDWKDICHDCYSRGKRDPIQPYKIAFHYKTCSDCGKLGVNCSGSNSFKTKCPECLKNNQSSTVASPGEFKVCGGCGSSNIPLSESWKKYCDACYKPALSSATNTNTTSVGTGGQSQTFTGQKVKCPKCQLMRIPAEKAHIFKVCYTCK